MSSHSQEIVNKAVKTILDDWGFPMMLSAMALEAGTLAKSSKDQGEPSPTLEELNKRLRDLANWTHDNGL